MNPILNSYSKPYKQFCKVSSSSDPEWMKSHRIRALKDMQTVSFPNNKNGSYSNLRLTNLKENLSQFDYIKEKSNTINIKDYFSSASYTLVFLDGTYMGGDINISSIKIESLLSCKTNEVKDFENLLKNQTDANIDYFESLNRSFLKEGLMIRILKDTIVDKPLHIININSNHIHNSCFFTRNMIYLEQGSQVQIDESCLFLNKKDEQISAFSNGCIDVVVSKFAKIKYHKIKSDNLQYHFHTLRIYQRESSESKIFFINTNGQTYNQRVEVFLKEEKASSAIRGLCLGNKTQVANFVFNVYHSAPKCTSNQFFKSILSGSSQGTYQGTIKVSECGTETKAYQLSKALLLGENSISNTKPYLMIDTDDVKCTHGATVTRLRKEELHYLRNRGITKKNSYQMLATGFARDILEQNKSMIFYDKISQDVIPCFLKECDFSEGKR